MSEIMDTAMQDAVSEAAVCPMHGIRAAAVPAPLAADAELYFPLHKSVITQYSTDGSGATELHLYYGDKEISFDEPGLFAFGESLAVQSRFAAGSAVTWGEGYEWPRVRELLEQLLEGGILRYADESTPPRVAPRDGARPSPLPPAQTAVARSWRECEAITEELTGRKLELGYLELVVPVFRVAHMALDADGRQVGEANVFPKPLRLDVPTKWRTCIYSGSRFQEERPMNVTALKTMRAQWPQMMSALSRIREAYLSRFPAARERWTVGDLERLATLVLAVPTYALVRGDKPVANGELHPALSCIFRVTDGLRMTTHQMLFVPVAEATLAPDSTVTSADVYAYAERNYSFHSTHGVCAGPRAMIEEFLAVLVDGVAPRDTVALDPAVESALDAMDAAFDYGLYGLQAHAVIFSLWPVMTRTYERLWSAVEAWPGNESATLAKLREHLREKTEILRSETLHATEAWRVNRESVYAHIYEHCAVGERDALPLRECIAARRVESLAERLTDLLKPQLGAGADALAVILAEYFAQAQSTIGLGCEIQSRINALLGRTQPRRAFDARDIDIHILLQGEEARRLPYLIDEIEALLGFRVSITKDAIEIDDIIKGRATSASARPTECRHEVGKTACAMHAKSGEQA